MTREEIRTRILNALNVSASNPSFWSTAEMDVVINEAQEALAEEAHSIHRTALIALRPGTHFYATRSIAADMMAPYRLWVQDTSRRLTAVSLDQLDRYHERWLDVTGIPEVWVPVSWDWLAVYPGTSTGGGVLRVDYIAWPRDLDADDDISEIYESDQETLVFYGIYQGLLKRWDVDIAMEAYGRFIDRLHGTKARAGVRQRESQHTQQRGAPGTPLRSDIGSRWT